MPLSNEASDKEVRFTSVIGKVWIAGFVRVANLEIKA
jgi:hypothetical protein